MQFVNGIATHSRLLGLIGLALCASSALSAAACEDSPRDEALQAESKAETLYAIASTSFNPEGESSYVALVDSLGRRASIDYGDVLEIGGGTSIFGMSEGKFFALGKAEVPTITRFEIDEDGSFVEGDTLSFQDYGLSGTWLDPGLVPILADDKAYLVDANELQVIIWDPSAMTITDSFPLEGVDDEDYPTTQFEPDPTLRGTELMIAVSHGNEDVTAPFSSLIVLDVERDRVARVVREERCGGLWDSVLDSRGDLYLATGVWDAAQHRTLGAEISPAPCMVRVRDDETEFDPDYFVDLSELADGRTAGALVAGPDDTAYVKVLDETELGPIDAESFDEVWGGAHWQWWRVELGASEVAEETDALPLSAAASGVLSVDGRTFLRNATADFAKTTLVDMSAETPREGLTLRGFPYGIVRVR